MNVWPYHVRTDRRANYRIQGVRWRVRYVIIEKSRVTKKEKRQRSILVSMIFVEGGCVEPSSRWKYKKDCWLRRLKATKREFGHTTV